MITPSKIPLSQAIRLGIMLGPQGFGFTSIRAAEARCVLGGALLAVGDPVIDPTDIEDPYNVIQALWPYVIGTRLLSECYSRNDDHVSREAIADYVEMFERKLQPLSDDPFTKTDYSTLSVDCQVPVCK